MGQIEVNRRFVACQFCGEQFEAKRRTAKYCSVACRSASARRRNRVTQPSNAEAVVVVPEVRGRHWWAEDEYDDEEPAWTGVTRWGRS